jgi:hypothetical protein
VCGGVSLYRRGTLYEYAGYAHLQIIFISVNTIAAYSVTADLI